ncbi:hypothetical protein RND71_027469 [Anisodus tanguticus]|uniref:50S ribosomal protein L31 n=1 Tax=Anisodus tanguticus TaxID=243964 RepID=A0AAE1RIZ0_9SOLA|nr:hypothetical protein RND71_027469 [Anisodus tanguticus]
MALTLSNTFLQKNVAPPTLSLKKVGIGSDQMRVRCRKKEIHPQFYDDAKVYCNGEHVMTTGGTKNEYTVDVWSGNHPFYQGSRSALLLDADQVEKFRKKFSGLTQIMTIPTLKGEIILPPKKKKPTKKK